MANNKLVDKEVLKKVREKLQQKIEDGIIVAGQALTSKAINPVSEESGTIQETPFINQGTGTANNTTVVDTSPVGKQLEKQGNTIVYNQLCSVRDESSWTIADTNITFTKSNGVITVNGSNSSGAEKYSAIGNVPLDLMIVGHKYLVRSGQNTIALYINAGGMYNTTAADYIGTLSETAGQGTTMNVVIPDGTTLNNLKIVPQLIDLTVWFNGRIPSDLSSNPDHFTWYYNGDLTYNTGEFRNCAGRYLECGQGRNVYNPEETYNRVIPNIEYYYYGGSTTTITFYDKDQNAISTASVSSGNTFTTPSNCIYINSSVTNNITISEYYTNGEDYAAYYPYVAPVTYDTGIEVLRRIPVASSDDIVDTKAPDGTITRNIGTVDMGTLNWNEAGKDETYVRAYVEISGMKKLANSVVAGKGLYSANYPIGIGNSPYGVSTKTYRNYVYVNLKISDIGWDGDSSTFRATVKAYLSGVTLYYELATPTTEQGTAFSENIQIHDYSYMAWKNTDNEYVDIPQGTKLFYPADYVLFTDTLYNHTNGDGTNLALQGQLSSGDPENLKGAIDLTNSLYALMKTNVGGTLRQQLSTKANVEFRLTNYIDLTNYNWTANASYSGVFNLHGLTVSAAANWSTIGAVLCPIYQTVTANQVAADGTTAIDRSIAVTPNGDVWVRDSRYSTPSELKAGLKGILLAYKKA